MADHAFHVTGNGSVTVTVLGRQFPDAQHYDDACWLDVLVDVQVPGYTAHFGGTFLRNDELEEFASELKRMHATLKGKSALRTMECMIYLEAEVNKLGQIRWTGETVFPIGDGNTLQFTLENDQSFLPGLIRELDNILKAFPIRGKRPESRRP